MAMQLGRERTRENQVELPVTALLRHVVALGSSGSGKTVLCKVLVEEAVCAGVPVICIDSQGDLCSLALTSNDVQADTPDNAAARAFAERADVVVFTPASRRGIPLCADPLDRSLALREAHARLHARSRAADMITAFLGYDLDSDDGAGLRAVVDIALGDMEMDGRAARRLADLSDWLGTLDDTRTARYSRYLDVRKLRTACQRLARLDVGARSPLFHDGLPIDIDMLLGRGDDGRAQTGTTRVSVIYLNTLHNQEDKDFFVATLVERLYAWMLANPSSTPQALLYIDEIAPFMPPVRKPACKPGLQLLFKQARKYGVCCLMATQNPGDVDYKAMAQFGTWALGRLTMRQDIDKIAPTLRSLAPTNSDKILARLAAQQPGQFQLLSPDHFEEVRELQCRWPHSAHHTLDEQRIEQLTDERWRERFPLPEVVRTRQLIPADEIRPMQAPAALVPPRGEKAPRQFSSKQRPPRQRSAPISPGAPHIAPPEPREPPESGHAAAAEAQRELDRMANILAMKKSLNAREFAENARLSEKKARQILQLLVASGHARSYRDGRSMRFFATSSGARPDLGLGKTVAVVEAEVSETRARELACQLKRSSFLGLLGADEEIESTVLLYRPVYQVVFEETIKRTGIERLLLPGDEHIVGTVYHHPSTLRVLRFTRKGGIVFSDDPGTHASRVDDFDGAVRFADVAPGTIAIDEEAWRARRDARAVNSYFRERFAARPKRVTPYFVPLWKLMLRQRERGNYRVVLIDGIVGKPVEWSLE